MSAAVVGMFLATPACSVSTSVDEQTGSEGTASAIQVPEEVRSKGAIDVATFFNYPPYTIGEQNGELQGIEPRLIRAITEKMGIEARFHDMAFEAMIPSVVNRRNDVMIGGLADTAERREQVSFVDIMRSELRALVRNGNPTGIDPSDPCGSSTSSAAGSYQAGVVQELIAKCAAEGKAPLEALTVNDPGAAFLAVVNGRTDFTLQDPAVAKYTDEQSTDLEMVTTPVIPHDGLVNGWVFAKDNEGLRTAFVQAINELIADGTWQQIMTEGGLQDVMLVPPMVNTEPVDVG